MILIDVWYRYRKPIVLSSMQKHQRRISSFISSMSHPLSKDLTVYHQTVKLYRVSLQWIRQVNYNSAMVELDLTGCVKFRGKPHLRQQCCNASIECKQVIIFSTHSARTISECEPHCFFSGTEKSCPPRPSWTRPPTSAKVRRADNSGLTESVWRNVIWMWNIRRGLKGKIIYFVKN